MVVCVVTAFGTVFAAQYPNTIDSYTKTVSAPGPAYYLVNAVQTSKDTVVVSLDAYTADGVYCYSGTNTIQETGKHQISVTHVWGPPYNSYDIALVSSNFDAKQYYFKEWKPNLFR
ncbi:MAG: hypothetical protein ACXVHR_02835 [Methanobacterium sp.]